MSSNKMKVKEEERDRVRNVNNWRKERNKGKIDEEQGEG